MSDRTSDGAKRDEQRLSRMLSYVLRHRPDTAGIVLDASGWTDVDILVAGLRRSGNNICAVDIAEIVRTSAQQRFELSPDGKKIRARQGHSVPVELDLPVVEPPEILWHGTSRRFLDSILAQGLRRGSRHHVHLSASTAAAQRVAQRRKEPVLLEVAAARMASDGHGFHVTSNGVWLTDVVPSAYLRITDEEV